MFRDRIVIRFDFQHFSTIFQHLFNIADFAYITRWNILFNTFNVESVEKYISPILLAEIYFSTLSTLKNCGKLTLVNSSLLNHFNLFPVCNRFSTTFNVESVENFLPFSSFHNLSTISTFQHSKNHRLNFPVLSLESIVEFFNQLNFQHFQHSTFNTLLKTFARFSI